MPNIEKIQVNGVLYDVKDADVGDISDLTTADKTSLVNAINELNRTAFAPMVKETVSGAIASFSDGSDGVIIPSLIASIEPVQSGSGDPSPSNVRPISGWDAVTVTRCGVNLWDEEWEVGMYNTTTGTKKDNATLIRSTDYIPIAPATTYYLKTPANIRLLYYDANKQYISAESGTLANVTFTTPANAAYLTFYCGTTYGTTYNNDISINYPSTDTSYHAYDGGSTHTTSLPSTVYGGQLDVVSGVLTVTKAMADMGTLNWQKDVGFFYYLVSDKANNANCISSIYPNVGLKTDSEVINGSDKVMAIGANNAKYILIKDTSYASASDFITAVTGQELVYELATPTTAQLTAQEVTTLLGLNNIYADSGSVEVTYVADLKTYIDNATS